MSGVSMIEEDLPHDIASYHQRTKHSPRRYALGPAYLDWDTQPNPFRLFEGARRVALPLRTEAATPAFDQLDSMLPTLLDAQSLGLFLELALGLSAWKQYEGNRWSLRNNPSSGNLHPTEGWVILPAMAGIGDGPGLYHYSPLLHSLEERRRLDSVPDLPDGAFLMLLSSIPWRESWKYGERAFRYCQHDAGHALAALAYAGACLGWTVQALATPSEKQLAEALGLARPDASHRYEREVAEMAILVSPHPLPPIAWPELTGDFHGQANLLSADHEPWLLIDRAVRLTEKPECPPLASPSALVDAPRLPSVDVPAGMIIRSRRSAQRMDGQTGISRDAFFRMLSRTLPDSSQVPWRAFPWPPRVALFLFVHRVDGLTPGLYVLVRDTQSGERLRAACNHSFAWRAVEDCPLPLFLLAEADLKRTTAGISCQQAIAGHSAFSLGMIADFTRTLAEEGEWAYRRLFWETGMIGQVLYLEAGAAGLSGTGIGCFHDDDVHSLLGLTEGSMQWQSLYHFTIGGALVDDRLLTLTAYSHLQAEA